MRRVRLVAQAQVWATSLFPEYCLLTNYDARYIVSLMNKTVNLSSLLGKHILTGVDYDVTRVADSNKKLIEALRLYQRGPTHQESHGVEIEAVYESLPVRVDAGTVDE